MYAPIKLLLVKPKLLFATTMSRSVSPIGAEDEWLAPARHRDQEPPVALSAMAPREDERVSYNNTDSGNGFDEESTAGDGHSRLSSSKQDVLPDGLANSRDDPQMPWHPMTLQKHTIYAFMAAFTLLVVALEVIFIISQKSQGLVTVLSNDGYLYYLWTYGPTAIFTLLSALWASVDNSAKVSTPWIRVQKAKSDVDVKRAFLLDYISPLSLLVPYRALRNRDTVVAATSFVLLLFSVMTIFSPSLIALTPTEVSIPVEARTMFVDDPSRLASQGAQPLINVIGLKKYKLEYPHGVSERFAYQSLNLLPDSVSELHVTVDGFSAELDCQAAKVAKFSASVELSEYGSDEVIVSNFSLDSPGCNITVSDKPSVYPRPSSSERTVLGRVMKGKCQSESEENDVGSDGLEDWRLVWVMAELDVDVTGTKKPDVTLQKSQQLVCKPSYTISDVDVVRNIGSAPQISLSKTPRPRTLPNVHAWDFAEVMIDKHNPYFETLTGIDLLIVENIELGWSTENSEDLYLSLDSFSTLVLNLGNESYPDEASLFNFTALNQSIQTHYRTLAKFMAEGALMKPTSNVIESGRAKVRQNRLVVQPLASQILVALCFLSVLILGFTLFVLPARFKLKGNPKTITGLMALAEVLASSFPKGLGASRLPELKEGVYNSTLTQHEAPSRAASILLSNNPGKPNLRNTSNLGLYLHGFVYLFIAGTIVLLEMLFRKSERDGGIGPAPQDQSYLRYLWTVLPALGSSLIGLFFVSLDSTLRIHAPYRALSRGPSPPERSVDLSFQGLLSPHALYREIKTRHFAPAMATATVLLTSLLVIVSGSIFFEQDQPLVVQKDLRLVGSFTSELYDESYDVWIGPLGGLSGRVHTDDSKILSSLVLQSNLSFPPFTYGELTFPALALENDKNKTASTAAALGSDNPASQHTEIRAVVPALRNGLTCYQHPQSDMFADILHVESWEEAKWMEGSSIRVNVTGEYCPSSVDPKAATEVTALLYIGDSDQDQNGSEPSEGVFGLTFVVDPWFAQLYACSNYFYVWGTYSLATSSVSASAMSCNASIETVDVDAVFFGPELSIRPDHPPRPREQTTHVVIPADNSTEQFRGATIYSGFSSEPLTEPGAVMDPFFAALTAGESLARFGISLPFSTLADRDPESESRVAEAVKLQHSIVMAQHLSSLTRIPFAEDILGDDVSFDLSHLPGVHLDDPGVFSATGQGRLNRTTYPATVAIRDSSPGGPGPRRRVMQDETATRIMQSLLGATLVCGLVAWFLTPPKPVLPRPPTSIASVLALLVDGNVYHHQRQQQQHNQAQPQQQQQQQQQQNRHADNNDTFLALEKGATIIKTEETQMLQHTTNHVTSGPVRGHDRRYYYYYRLGMASLDSPSGAPSPCGDSRHQKPLLLKPGEGIEEDGSAASDNDDIINNHNNNDNNNSKQQQQQQQRFAIWVVDISEQMGQDGLLLRKR